MLVGKIVNGKYIQVAEHTAEDDARMEEMLRLRQPPMSNTDREFMEGHCNGRQFEHYPVLGDHYKRVAESAGQDVTGKVYLSGLAAYPGDPRAWVSGRDDARRVCEERGWDCDGAVKVKSAKHEHSPGPAVDPALVEEAAQDAVADNPDLSRMDPGELRHNLTEQMKPHWSS